MAWMDGCIKLSPGWSRSGWITADIELNTISKPFISPVPFFNLCRTVTDHHQFEEPYLATWAYGHFIIPENRS